MSGDIRCPQCEMSRKLHNMTSVGICQFCCDTPPAQPKKDGCRYCGTPLVRYAGESQQSWNIRKYCTPEHRKIHGRLRRGSAKKYKPREFVRPAPTITNNVDAILRGKLV